VGSRNANTYIMLKHELETRTSGHII